MCMCSCGFNLRASIFTVCILNTFWHTANNDDVKLVLEYCIREGRASVLSRKSICFFTDEYEHVDYVVWVTRELDFKNFLNTYAWCSTHPYIALTSISANQHAEIPYEASKVCTVSHWLLMQPKRISINCRHWGSMTSRQ